MGVGGAGQGPRWGGGARAPLGGRGKGPVRGAGTASLGDWAGSSLRAL